MMPARRDAVIGGCVATAFVVLGVVLALLWFRLAPAELSVVLRDGSTAPCRQKATIASTGWRCSR